MGKRSNHSSSKQQKETVQQFIKEFTSSYDEIENDIVKQETHDQFKELKIRAFKLDEHLADNASILPSYIFEAKTRMMVNLKNKINEKKKKITQKKKKKKKKKKKS